jgi:NADPH:quinone reductase-like Zn-dependent oxidoreductase
MIGADHVIDYAKEDFSSTGRKYDVIFDTVYKSNFDKCLDSVTEEGYYLMANPGPRRMLRALWVSRTTRRKVVFQFARETVGDLTHIAQLIAEGRLRTVIDRRYPLSEITKAHDYVGKGLKKGNVIIVVSDDN